MAEISASYKVNFLQERAASALVSRLVTIYRRAVEAVPGIAVGVGQAIELDLVYCVCRHIKWLHAPLLDSVCTEFLIADYRISRDQAEQLVGEVMDAARRLQPQNELIEDRDFLRYILVLSIVCQSQDDLIEDLGIGRDLVGRLRRAAEAVDSNGPNQVTFLPDVDRLFSEIIVELGAETRATPWIAYVNYVGYCLQGQSSALEEVLKDQGGEWLFDLLMELASQDSSSADGLMVNANEALLKGSKGPMEPTEWRVMFEELERLGFVFTGSYGPKGPLYQASQITQRLTSEAYAHQLVKSPTVNGIAGLNKFFQLAVVEKLQGSRAHIGLELLKRTPFPLDHIVLPGLVRVLKADFDTGRLFELLEKHADNPLRWVRKGVCEAAEELRPLPKAEALIRQYASQDPSESVRSAALKLLAQDTTPESYSQWGQLWQMRGRL